jgi:DNA-directed RNA polymerase specialized sigma24 family protein
VLAQRHVDRLRATRRLDPLPEDESAGAALRSSVPANPDVERQSGLVRKVLAKAIEALPSGDRLRLGCYYAQNLTLAEIGRLFGEHEATASRHLSRIRKTIRHDVEQRLRDDERLDAGAIEECFEAVLEDAGTLDLTAMLGPGDERKKSGHARSKE